MIFIDPSHSAISTLYGEDGHAELIAFMKRLRLDRTALKNEGHPTDEYLLIPTAKMTGEIVQLAATVGTFADKRRLLSTKVPRETVIRATPSTYASAADEWSRKRVRQHKQSRGGKREIAA